MSSLTSSIGPRLHRWRRAVRRTVLARRRLLAALCAGVAIAAGVHAAAAPAPPTVSVTTAARDLPAGTVLTDADLATTEFAPDLVPSGAATAATGRTLASPVRTGEPVTDVRLIGQTLAEAHPELTTLPVRFPDAGAARLLDPGMRIDLIATDPQAGTTRLVATDVLVLATPEPTERASRQVEVGTAGGGALVLLGVPPSSATDVVDASVRWFLSYAFTH